MLGASKGSLKARGAILRAGRERESKQSG